MRFLGTSMYQSEDSEKKREMLVDFWKQYKIETGGEYLRKRFVVVINTSLTDALLGPMPFYPRDSKIPTRPGGFLGISWCRSKDAKRKS
jgi:hypothetical protein